jgi:quercetin dioxygenase-like cupin family protein
MRYIKPADKEWQEREGYSKKIFLDDKELDFPGALVQEIKIEAGETAANHHHEKQTEVFFFLNSVGHFVVDGKKIVPEKGDVLVIEPGDRHEVVNKSDEDYLYMAFKLNYDQDDLVWD